MSGGGNTDANRLAQEQLTLQQQDLAQKREAIAKLRMATIEGQGTQQFTNPDNPHPPAQIIQ